MDDLNQQPYPPQTQLPPPISPTPQSTIPQEPKRNWVKPVLIAVIILPLVWLIFQAYALFSFLNPSNTIKKTQTTTLSPTPTLDPTANWKTYTNTKYGYSLKYPSSFFIYDFNEPIYEPKGNVNTTEISNYETSDFSIDPDDINRFIMLIQYPPDKATDLSTVRTGYKDTQYIHYNIIDYSIDNQPALKIKTTSQSTEISIEVITLYKSKVLFFLFRPTNSKYASYFDQILSTFKFTN